MDIYLLMSWRDARLVNRYDQPILVKEEEILEKIWRPDPFFANAKEAEFHEVTFLNFLMRIYSDGLVLYETRSISFSQQECGQCKPRILPKTSRLPKSNALNTLVK